MSSTFYNFEPHTALNSIEDLGFQLTGRYIQMNSYENRVFDFEQEDQEESLIAKFYRPQRWTLEAIHEEHQFLFELQENGIPAVAPLILNNNQTTFYTDNLISTLFPKARGRLVQEFLPDDLKRIGRLLARIHNVGAQKKAKTRPLFGGSHLGIQSLNILNQWIAPEVSERYKNASYEIIDFLDDFLDENLFIRIHGDCHRGNILQTDPQKGEKEFFFIDFDDFCTGPPIQDFWMLFSGDDLSEETDLLLSGYTELRNFDEESLRLIEALRGLRIINYAAWIAKRWEDPSFKKLFPHFEDYLYWAEEVEALEKISWSL